MSTTPQTPAANAPMGPAFEAWLKTRPDARFWDATDAMRAAFIGGADLRDPAAVAVLVARFEKALTSMQNKHHDLIVVMQSVWIEWKHGKGPEPALAWIQNALDGPGLVPSESDPWAKDAQAYFDANKSKPFPACFCGRPSNPLWKGKGFFCSEAHLSQASRWSEAFSHEAVDQS